MAKSRDAYEYGFTKSGKIVHTGVTRTVDYESWALALCDLLDKIELSVGDKDEVHRLCQMRFDIAREHGLTIKPGEPASALSH